MLYGRGDERDRIGVLLEDARRSRSGVLLLRGDPGIGKTALLQDARERAGDMHVLIARGVESESQLPFAGLHQLLRPALHLLQTLPAPQSAALQGAFGLAERPGEDRFLIGAACLTLLSELAEGRPVLCLIDDAQWLDVPSRDALWFVARRLDAEGIVMLLAARTSDAEDLEAEQIPSIQVPGLDANAAVELISRGAAGPVAPAVRDMIVSQASGNALALVELPSAMSVSQLAGSDPLPDGVPLTPDVERLFLDRVRRLPEPTQRLLLIAATDETEQVGTILAAGKVVGIDPEALGAAELAGLVSVSGNRLEMRHPLVRSAIYQGATSSERRAAHLALADTMSGAGEADQRAWHRAAVAVGTDAGLADELERTAARARLRSGHAAAGTALERAAELSAEPEPRGRRLVAAATAAWHAGQPERATALLERASPLVSEPRLRADLEHIRGVIQFRCGTLSDACSTLMAGAAEVSALDPGKALEMLFDAANAGVDSGNYASVAEAGRRAAALPRGDDDDLRFLADLLVGVGSLVEGKNPREVPLVLEVIERADRFEEPRWLAWAAVGAGAVGDITRETTLHRRAAELARASGAVDALVLVLQSVSVDGIMAGRHGVVAEATEGHRLAREAGLGNPEGLLLGVLAWFAAVQGRGDECRSFAADVTDGARRRGLGLAYSLAEWALALLDLAGGRPDEAVPRLAGISTAPPGLGHPYAVLVSAPDFVEAAVRAGRSDDAAAAYRPFEAFAEAGAPAWARALAARCRALLTTGAEAEREFTAALNFHAEQDRPFDRARTELLLGEHLRRNRQRHEARDHLRAAIDGFEHLRAEPWAERARTELRASGETARKRDPSTLAQLTPQEVQVARFVAEGLSNKEVAAQLFLSPRTIDSHLRNVFAKLGITSRTQLAHLHAQTAGALTLAQPTVASV